VVKLGHAAVADPAMFCSKRSDNSTSVTKPQNVRTTWALPFVVTGNLFDGAEKKKNISFSISFILLSNSVCGPLKQWLSDNPPTVKITFSICQLGTIK
jgi:hypothetical protein